MGVPASALYPLGGGVLVPSIGQPRLARTVSWLVLVTHALTHGLPPCPAPPPSRNLPAIMTWVEAQKPGVGGVNIITSDFVELTDFANTVINLNNLLLSERDLRGGAS